MSGPKDILILRTGTANLASVIACFERLGARPRLCEDADLVNAGSHVVLPGVGTFGASARCLRGTHVIDALRSRIEAGRPTLAICVGHQLLCESSAESPGEPGLGLLPLTVQRFEGANLRVPHIGWNRVETTSSDGLLEPGYAYFANSYAARDSAPGWRAAWSDHGGPFLAALEREAVLSCQFHPELSGRWGLSLLGRWLAKEDPGC